MNADNRERVRKIVDQDGWNIIWIGAKIPRPQETDRINAGFVLIAQRKMQHEIPVGDKS